MNENYSKIVVNRFGYEFDLEAASILMDDEIREMLANEDWESDQAFFDAYVELDPDFELNKPNPQW